MSEDGNQYNSTSFRSQHFNSNRSHHLTLCMDQTSASMPAPIAGIRAKASPACAVRSAPSEDRSAKNEIAPQSSGRNGDSGVPVEHRGTVSERYEALPVRRASESLTTPTGRSCGPMRAAGRPLSPSGPSC